MIRLGLLGHPVAHSLSPAMHAAALREAGIHGTYELLDAPRERAAEVVRACRAADFCGLNVTIPHKTLALTMCDYVEPVAASAGAVNTLVFEDDGTVAGANTDVDGFASSLLFSGFSPEGARALVLGAGGAARAVVVALRGLGVHPVYVASRRPEPARAMAGELGAEAVPLSVRSLDGLRVGLVVNATPAGMKVEPGTSGWEDVIDAFSRTVPIASLRPRLAFDLVYSPAETPFTAFARRCGCEATTGLDMLVRQGALSFQRFTGVAAEAVIPAMRAALTESAASSRAARGCPVPGRQVSAGADGSPAPPRRLESQGQPEQRKEAPGRRAPS